MSLTSPGPSSVASFAYNPTPLGLGLGIAGSVLGGKGGKNITESLVPSYENGDYYVTGSKGFTPRTKVDASGYQISGDNGNYDLMRFASDNNKINTLSKTVYGNTGQMANARLAPYGSARGALGNDDAALDTFDAKFGTPQQNNMAASIANSVYKAQANNGNALSFGVANGQIVPRTISNSVYANH